MYRVRGFILVVSTVSNVCISLFKLRLMKGFSTFVQYYRQPHMFEQILHYMNTALTSMFTLEALFKIYAYGFRVRKKGLVEVLTALSIKV